MRGTIDGRRVSAHWQAGVLACDGLFRSRAELTASIDDVFRTGDSAGEAAPWSEPVSAEIDLLLSLVRACDRLEWVSFETYP